MSGVSHDMPVIIRPAAEADLPALGRLGALLVRVHHDFDPLRFLPAMPGIEGFYAEFLGRQRKLDNAVVLVADRGGQVVGYAYGAIQGPDYMALRGPAGVLNDIVVDPGDRGRGIGRQLLDAVMAELKRRGAPRVVLSTAEANGAAQRLFARAGFRNTMVEMTAELGENAEPG